MKQRTHTWLAIRAIALLEDAGDTPDLVKLLKPHTKSAAIGSWIPDLSDARLGSGDIDNHVFKMKPYNGADGGRFIRNKRATLRSLGTHRKTAGFIKTWGNALDGDWWERPYKADPAPGQHLANRAMALTTTLVDQLILGDPKVARLVPGVVRFAHRLDSNARTRSEEAATHSFILSHFVADACQPCHCDARRLFGFSKGVHKELEQHWDKRIGTYFDKSNLLSCNDSVHKVLNHAREVDASLGIVFENTVPEPVAKDAWLEVLTLCRASFALAGVIVSPQVIPYGSGRLTSFERVFKDPEVDANLLPELDHAVLHDAVLNIAILWKAVWERFD